MTNNTKLLELLTNYTNTYHEIELNKLKNAIIENIREESAKNSGRKSQYTIAKKIASGKGHTFIGYIPFDNRYVFCDGHRALISETDLGFQESKNTLDFSKIMVCDCKNSFELDLQELKTYCATLKAEKNLKKPYIFYIDGIKCCINPFYAVDSMIFTGSNVFYTDLKLSFAYKNNISPYFQMDESQNFTSLILPVNAID